MFAIEQLQIMVGSMPTLTDAQIADTVKAYLEWALKHAVDGTKMMGAGPIVVRTENGDEAEAQSAQQLADGTPSHERAALVDGLKKLRSI